MVVWLGYIAHIVYLLARIVGVNIFTITLEVVAAVLNAP